MSFLDARLLGNLCSRSNRRKRSRQFALYENQKCTRSISSIMFYMNKFGSVAAVKVRTDLYRIKYSTIIYLQQYLSHSGNKKLLNLSIVIFHISPVAIARLVPPASATFAVRGLFPLFSHDGTKPLLSSFVYVYLFCSCPCVFGSRCYTQGRCMHPLPLCAG